MTDMQFAIVDLERWLNEYGLSAHDVADVDISIGRHPDIGSGVRGKATFYWYRHDADGNKYPDGKGNAATGRTTVPLRSLPVMSPPPPQ
jgi:hypothetical protein